GDAEGGAVIERTTDGERGAARAGEAQLVGAVDRAGDTAGETSESSGQLSPVLDTARTEGQRVAANGQRAVERAERGVGSIICLFIDAEGGIDVDGAADG